MIRPARLGDVADMTRMAKRFFDASGLDLWFRFKPQSFAKTVGLFIENSQAVILVAEKNSGLVGMAAALAYPCWYDADHMTAQELFWWIEPEHRGGPLGEDMLKMLEKWARDSGCLTMEMGALEVQRPDVMARVYARRDYAPKERVFCKRLT